MVKKLLIHKLIILAIAAHLSAGFDARTTSQFPTQIHEANPLVRPFLHTPALYPAISADVFLCDVLALRRKTKLATGCYAGTMAEHLILAIHNKNLEEQYEKRERPVSAGAGATTTSGEVRSIKLSH